MLHTRICLIRLCIQVHCGIFGLLVLRERSSQTRQFVFVILGRTQKSILVSLSKREFIVRILMCMLKADQKMKRRLEVWDWEQAESKGLSISQGGGAAKVSRSFWSVQCCHKCYDSYFFHSYTNLILKTKSEFIYCFS